MVVSSFFFQTGTFLPFFFLFHLDEVLLIMTLPSGQLRRHLCITSGRGLESIYQKLLRYDLSVTCQLQYKDDGGIYTGCIIFESYIFNKILL